MHDFTGLDFSFDETWAIIYKNRMNDFSHSITKVGLVMLVCVLTYTSSVVSVNGQTGNLAVGPDPKIMQELKFAEALNSMVMPDYAQIILDRLPNTPEVAVLKKRLLIDSFIATGKFDDVKAIIAKESNQESEATWGMKLALADGYYAWGKYNEAQEIYKGFFNKYPTPPAGLNDFYMDSAYKFSQMLLLMGDKKQAMEAYKNVLKAKVPTHVERQIWAETADLMLQVAEATADKAAREALYKEVKALCDKILWVQDLWFGKAIVYLAHMKVMQGDPEGATKLIDEYKQSLQAIDDALKQSAAETGEDMTKLSPMAECRYLIAVILQKEAETQLKAGNKEKALELLLGKQVSKDNRTQGAFQHFMNVFIKYPNTSWAPDAGEQADIIKALAIKDLGVKEINVNITAEMREKVRKAQFQEARSLFNRQLFQEASEAYVKVLNRFPDGDTAISAISELARCYIETEEEIYAQMTERYLAESFGRKDSEQALAGDKLLGIAQMYEDRKQMDEKDAVYDLYFQYFPKHSRAPAMLFQFGEAKLTSQDYAGALKYFGNIVENHKTSNLYQHALFKMASCYGLLEQRPQQIKTSMALVAYLEGRGRPELLILSGKFDIAQSYRQLGMELMTKEGPKYQEAGNKYMSAAAAKYYELIKMLTGEAGAPYKANKEWEEACSAILEGSMFYKGYTYTLLTQPADKLNTYKALALQGYKELVSAFPKSKFAPQAYSQIGTIYTMFGKADEAEQALRQLQKDYPDSPEAQNSDFTLGMNLLKMGRRKEATSVFKKMFEGQGKYSAQKILIAGQELWNAKEYDIALDAYNKALSMSQERNIAEPAKLGKGKVLTEQKKYEEAVEVLDGMMNEYKGSGYTPETGFYLSRAASELAKQEADENKRFDLFNKAMSALKMVRKYAGKDSGKKAQTDVEIGRINELKAQSEKEFGQQEKADEYKGEAIGAYKTIMMLADPRDAAVRPHLEKAFQRCLPMLFDAGEWGDVISDADQYIKLFPNGEYASEIRTWKNKAVVKQRMEGGSATSGTETPDESTEESATDAGISVPEESQVNQEESK